MTIQILQVEYFKYLISFISNVKYNYYYSRNNLFIIVTSFFSFTTVFNFNCLKTTYITHIFEIKQLIKLKETNGC